MKIAYIAAGAAGMLCGSCLHDNTLAAALRRSGHDTVLIPTYTPLRTDEESVSIDQVFYGGINVYLQQKSALFRHTPRVVDFLLDRPGLLRWLSRFAVTTDGHDLGALAVSVLQGEDGNQRKELARLQGWLEREVRPGIVCLTNSMLLGLAGPLRRALDVPVLCALQGEDLFLEQMEEPFRRQALDLLRTKARDADGFLAASDYCARHMTDLLHLPPRSVHVVRLGINLHGFLPADRPPGDDYVIGYLARISPEKGLHLLVEAFQELAGRVAGARLHVAGYVGRRDRSYLADRLGEMVSLGLDDRFRYLGEVDRLRKLEFLRSIDVLSVPTVYPEPKGLFVLEALAGGVPVVEPRHGAFPELIDLTGGGILVEPNSTRALAAGLEELFHDPRRRRRLGGKGREAVVRDFSDDAMARRTVAVFSRYAAAVV